MWRRGNGLRLRMGHKGGGLATLRLPTGLWVLRTGGVRLDSGFAARWMPQSGGLSVSGKLTAVSGEVADEGERPAGEG